MAVWHNIIVDGRKYEWQVGDDWIHIHGDGKQLCLIPKQNKKQTVTENFIIKHVQWIQGSPIERR